MSDRLTIGYEMRMLDTKQRNFYGSLTDEERKKFSNFLMIRWSSCIDGNKELQEYYVQSCNHYLNKHFFTINKHPKLQWLSATAVSPGLGAMKHNWIPPKKKESGAGAKRKQLQEIYPHYKDDEIDVMMKITTQKEIDAWFQAAGYDKK